MICMITICIVNIFCWFIRYIYIHVFFSRPKSGFLNDTFRNDSSDQILTCLTCYINIYACSTFNPATFSVTCFAQYCIIKSHKSFHFFYLISRAILAMKIS